MKKYKREHDRHSIIHLKAVYLRIIGKKYPVIDLSAGGISIVDEINGSGLRRELKIKDVELFLGNKILKLDCEVVFEDNNNHIFGMKIVKFHGDSKKLLASFADNMQKSLEGKKVIVNSKEHFFEITSNKITIKYENNNLEVLKKPLFSKEEDALNIALAYICGLTKDEHPTTEMAAVVLKRMKG